MLKSKLEELETKCQKSPILEELEALLVFLDEAVILYKVDTDLNLTYVNELFCKTSGYSEDELLGKNFMEIAELTPKEKKEIEELGDKKEIRVKKISKDGTAFFVKEIFRKFNDEYLSIGFLVTSEEEEKREFKRQVMQTLTELRKEKGALKRKIRDIEEELKIYKNKAQENEVLKEKLQIEKQRTSQALQQVSYLEKQLNDTREKMEKQIAASTEKIYTLQKEWNRYKKIVEKYEIKIEKQEKVINASRNALEQTKQELKELQRENEMLKKRLAAAKKKR